MARVCAVAIAVLLGPVLCRNLPEDPFTKELYVAVGSAVEVPSVTPRDGSLLQTLFLRPGYPPSRPQVKCWSPSYPKHALCSWGEGPEPLLPTRYTATYETGLRWGHLLQPCLPVPGLRHHCQLNIRMYHQDAHSINVTATNPLGSAYTFFSFMVEDVVKPDPPVDVTVVQDSKAKTLSVTWAPPPSWSSPAFFPLKYMVRYHTGNSKTARKLGPFLSPAMALKGLRGGETYTVQVSAQDRLVGQSSDWSPPVSATVLPRGHAGQR
ncbi:hypothetical protein COCON_G00087620 [Conger conger]|uniref:Fibronectin type-III domain-containing protein n=1 Tax=Conger conger TaxID=82655 RepID=A0A9Q1DKC4_CONCO|nr:hypothetical protein COCON_G00087620 [Conger conger]